MNRQEKRQWAKRINTPQKLEQFSSKLERRIRREYDEKYREMYNQKIQRFTEGFSLVTAYVLSYKLGFGKKRLYEIMEAIDNNIDCLAKDYVTLDEIREELKNKDFEMTFDFEKFK